MHIYELILGDCATAMVGAICLFAFGKKVIKTIYSASRSGSKLRLLLLFNFPLDYKAVADVYRAEQSLLES